MTRLKLLVGSGVFRAFPFVVAVLHSREQDRNATIYLNAEKLDLVIGLFTALTKKVLTTTEAS
jgi:hypothetical protein